MKINGFKSSKRFWASFIVFIGLLAFFYFVRQNYILPMLVIKYDAQPKALVNVYWDSGQGFNDREHNSYLVYCGENQLTDLPLPRERIRAVKLVTEKCSILKIGTYDWAQNGKVITLEPKTEGNALVLTNLRVVSGKNTLLFPLQVLFAAFLALLFYVLTSRINQLNRLSALKAVQELFSRKRRGFWLVFALFSIWWLIWLCCQWPGILTRDSYYFTLREIAAQEFDGICPVSYNLLVLALFQIAASPAMVSIVQILAMAMLTAHIGYFCLRRGVNRKVLIIFGALLFVSVPVATYNLLLVKDVAFSLLVLYFGWLLYLLFLARKDGKRVFINNAELVLNGVLLALLATVRYNGVAYIFLIPVAILLLRLMNIRRWLIFTLTALVVFAGLTTVSRSVQKVAPSSVDAFFRHGILTGPLFSAVAGAGDITFDEKQVLAKVMPVDEIRRRYVANPRPEAYGNMTIGIMGLEHDALVAYEKTRNDIIMRHPWLVLKDRLLMFTGALGLSSNVYIFTDETQTHDGYVYWRPLESFKYDKSANSFSGLSFLQNRLMQAATRPPWSLWIFNTVPALLLLMFLLTGLRRRPAAALFAAVFLINVPQLFVVLSTCEWRMYYYLYIAGFFAIPLWLAEREGICE